MAKNSLTGNKKIFLILGDVIILYLALGLSLLIRFQAEFSQALWQRHLLPFTIVFAIFIIVFYIDDLYEINFGSSKYNLLSKIFKNVIISSVIAMVFFYLGQDRLFTIRPQRVLVFNAAIFFIASYLWHLAFLALTRSAKIANNLLIIGNNNLVAEIKKVINEKPELGFIIKKIIDNTDEENLKNLKNICQQNDIHSIISTIHPRENALLSKSLFDCLPLRLPFYDITTFYEKITGKVPVTTIEQVWFLENLSENNKKLYEFLKKILEVMVAIVLLIIFLPFAPLVALAIKATSKGPIFFSQNRLGKDGKIFKTIKFRSMVVDAEKNGAQWAVKNDPRVTKVGKILRKTRIDEIPQLFLVITGKTSLIGPRPERPEMVEDLEKDIPFYKERLIVKPGITGWAQVMGPDYGGSKEETLEKLQYDLYYVKNRSLALDLNIILKTIKTVLSRKGH